MYLEPRPEDRRRRPSLVGAIVVLILSSSARAGPIAGYMGEDGGRLEAVQEGDTVFLRLRSAGASSFGPEGFALTTEHLNALSALSPGITTLSSPGEPILILDREGDAVTVRLDVESRPTVILTQANLADMASRIQRLSPAHRLTAEEKRVAQKRAFLVGGVTLLFGALLLLCAAKGWRFLNTDRRRTHTRGPASIPERAFLAVAGSILVFVSVVYLAVRAI